MIVVLVLTINCHVSEKPSNGPLNAHSTRKQSAATNIHGLPRMVEILVVNLVNISAFFLLIACLQSK
ncbi:hypothetical protein D3C86_1869080 [compost metagenome]